MLPINLLPNYIFDKNKKRNAFIVYLVAIAAVAGAFIFWSNQVQHDLEEQNKLLATAQEKQRIFSDKEAQIAKIKAQISETETKQGFIANAQVYNDSWPAAYSLMKDLTSRDVLLKSMTIKNHRAVGMAAFAANEMVIARWWIALKNHKEIFDNVTMQIPTHPFAPAKAGGVAGGPGSGAPMSGGMPNSGGMGRPSLTPMGASASASAAGPAGMPGSGGFPGSGGMPGSGGAAGGDAVGPAMIEDRPGINFMVSALLHTPLANGQDKPVWPGGGGAPAPGGMPGSGGFPGSGGMPGGGAPGPGAGGRN